MGRQAAEPPAPQIQSALNYLGLRRLELPDLFWAAVQAGLAKRKVDATHFATVLQPQVQGYSAGWVKL